MRSIAIIGAGQGGLQLGIGLIKEGYHVTLFSNTTSEQLAKGKILSSQGMFHSALELERGLKINFWEQQCPQNKFVSFTIATPGIPQQAVSWRGKTKFAFQAVDQRLKFSGWMKEFERLGGNLIIQNVGLTELDKIAKWHELTIVAGGKGEISQSFQRDKKRSHFDTPQRALSCLYVNGMSPVSNYPGVRANLIPGVGEYFTMPGLTLNGPCEMMLFEGIPDGPFDCWGNMSQPEQQLEKSIELLQKYVPWEAERCRQLALTDNQAVLIGRYTPIVRKPTFKLPCGKDVLGLGDTVVLNDPVAGQGANNASKGAHLYMNRIKERGKECFDTVWMKETFERYWNLHAKWGTKWTHMLLMPPEPHIVALLSAAAKIPALADTLADGFDDPSTFFPWISHPDDTKKLIADFEEEKAAQNSKNNLLRM